MDEFVARLIIGITLVCLGLVSGRYRKIAAMDDPSARRADENRKLIATRLLVAVPAQLILLGDLFVRGWFDWARIGVPDVARWVAVGTALSCAPLAVWMFRHLGTNVTATALTKNSHRLVTTGPYRFVRHPMYSIGSLLVTSFAVILDNGLLLAWVGVFLVAWLLIVIPEEERSLIERFGDDYRRYKRRVGALFPRPPLPGSDASA